MRKLLLAALIAAALVLVFAMGTGADTVPGCCL